MSAAKMLADSTQGDPLTDTAPGMGAKRRKSHDKRKTKKQKKETKKKSSKRSSSENDPDSDLDLEKELKPIGDYIKDRRKMLEQMFHCLKGGSLQRNLPDVLKELTIEDLKRRCQNQLEIMSKKRIIRILAGDDPANISSSGTDDESSEDEDIHKGKDVKEDQEQMADSTSQPGEEPEGEEPEGEDQEEDEEVDAEAEEGDVDDIQGEETLEEEEDVEEGEMTDESDETPKEHNAQSDVESGHYSNTDTDGLDGQHCPKEDNSIYSGSPEPGEVDVPSDQESMTDPDGEDHYLAEVEEGEESLYGDMEDTEAVTQESQGGVPEGQGEDQGTQAEEHEGVTPVLSQNQMELLELEMRARAIKAMLKAHEVREKRLEEG
ncbi:caspase activity and apoptosis inhibitor 1-like [Ylistrum balloti]|uniref:caspase activity and apoptosis inhibitor 1-like n=1 Tax=Ylistrum balloti TaxID=509963 RepID=UPI002905B64E|nr:caspase activity and apoptosis inhibitor 1-like [Ylistrum balloti]